jgi:hypothetical protein
MPRPTFNRPDCHGVIGDDEGAPRDRCRQARGTQREHRHVQTHGSNDQECANCPHEGDLKRGNECQHGRHHREELVVHDGEPKPWTSALDQIGTTSSQEKCLA